MVGLYLAPRDASTLDSFITTIIHRPRGAELLVTRYFNTELESPDRNESDEEIAAEMVTDGLEDMTEHLLPPKLPWKWNGRACSMLYCGQEARSRTDCILGKEQHLLQNVDDWVPIHNTDHYMVLR